MRRRRRIYRSPDVSIANREVLEESPKEDADDGDALDQLEGDVEDADLSELISSVTEEGIGLLNQEIDDLESFVSDRRGVDQGSKTDQLAEDINELDREGHSRVMIFTRYTDTMDHIRDRLVATQAETVATYSDRGGKMCDGDEDSSTAV